MNLISSISDESFSYLVVVLVWAHAWNDWAIYTSWGTLAKKEISLFSQLYLLLNSCAPPNSMFIEVQVSSSNLYV